jgi:RimJ/RimL family protein N-acetyltransferase
VPLRVREATPEDTEAIVSVTAEGWRAGYGEIVAPERLADLPIERWRHEVGVGLRRPIGDAFTRVAEIDDGFAGYCYVAAPAREAVPGARTAELVAMYVASAHWRHGVGTALMEAALDLADNWLDLTRIELSVYTDNAAGTALYEKFGFEIEGTHRRYAFRNGDYVDAYSMARLR